MRAALSAIQDGSFAREWIAEMDKGSTTLLEYRRALGETQIEQVGKRLRALGHQEVQEARGVG
jgi:ketol-acid reductoisomerase